MREKVRREARALVSYVELDHAVPFLGTEQHDTRAVGERVVDEVPERVLETPSIGACLEGASVCDVDRAADLPGAGCKAGRDGVEEGVDLNRLALERELRPVGASE